MRTDLHNHIKPLVAFNSQTVDGSGTSVGNIIDIKGYGAVEFLLSCGTRTDGTYTPVIEEGDDPSLGDAVAVDDANLFSTEALSAMSASNSIKKLGYRVGKYRYVRLSIVASGVTTGCLGVHSIAVLANADAQPTT